MIRSILSLLTSSVSGGLVSLASGIVGLCGKITDLYGRGQLIRLGEDRAISKMHQEFDRKQSDAKKAGDSVDTMSDDDVDRELRGDYRKD